MSPNKFLVIGTDFVESDIQFWFCGGRFVVRTAQPDVLTNAIVFHRVVKNHEIVDNITKVLLSSPCRRIYGAELGTFAALSGSSLSAYQAPHRRFYVD